MKSPALPIEHPDRMLVLAQDMQAAVHGTMEEALAAGYEVFEIESMVRFLCQEFVSLHRRDANVWPDPLRSRSNDR